MSAYLKKEPQMNIVIRSGRRTWSAGTTTQNNLQVGEKFSAYVRLSGTAFSGTLVRRTLLVESVDNETRQIYAVLI